MGKGHVLAEFEPLGSFQDVSRLCGSARAARQHLLVDAMCFVHDHINIMSQKALQDMALGRCEWIRSANPDQHFQVPYHSTPGESGRVQQRAQNGQNK